jgi:hypothetical protein
MVVFDREGRRVSLRAEEDALVLVLTGEPLGEPVVRHGPFVMSTGKELYQAFEDYQSGRMGHLS